MAFEAEGPPVHDIAAKRFEITVDGKVAFSKYLLVGEKMIIEHTEVPVELEGKGIAAQLVRSALDYARAQKFKVMPLCPFTAGFIHRHAEYQDLVLKRYRHCNDERPDRSVQSEAGYAMRGVTGSFRNHRRLHSTRVTSVAVRDKLIRATVAERRKWTEIRHTG